MDPRIKIRHLQCFSETVLNRSISRAADKLAVTQPAVSKTINELEQILGVRLLRRTNKGIAPTAEGEKFYSHIMTALVAFRQGVAVVTQQEGVMPRLAVGVLPNVAATVMPTVISRFKEDYPGVIITIATGSNAHLLALLRQAEVDMVMGRLSEPRDMVELTFEHLYTEKISVVVRPNHPLGRTALRADKIGNYPVILPTTTTVIRYEVDRFLISQGITGLPNLLETLSPTFARTFTLMTDAVWFVPHGIVAEDLSQGLLWEIVLPEGAMEGPVGLTLHSARQLNHPGSHLAHLIRSHTRAES
ncbi:pca operon transcription factor PcaQ [Neorhizobium sp. DT-125]|uniref:pca operon transcription factor PcaQ n=1 Tax=Neorhizobium sp. DT-125 TaxID=3396163 RepID=UPI003F1AB30D